MSRYTIEYSRERGPQGASGSTDASAITSGTLNAARLPATVVQTTGTYANPAWITELASTKITGTLTKAQQHAQTAYYDAAGTWAQAQTFRGDITVENVGGDDLILGMNDGSGKVHVSSSNNLPLSINPNGDVILNRVSGTVTAVNGKVLLSQNNGMGYLRLEDGTNRLEVVNVGNWKIGSNTNIPIEIHVNGSEVAEFSSTGATFNGAVIAKNGISFDSNDDKIQLSNNLGYFQVGSNTEFRLRAGAGGVRVFNHHTGQLGPFEAGVATFNGAITLNGAVISTPANNMILTAGSAWNDGYAIQLLNASTVMFEAKATGISSNVAFIGKSSLDVQSPGIGTSNWWRMRADDGSAFVLSSQNTGVGISLSNTGLLTANAATFNGTVTGASGLTVNNPGLGSANIYSVKLSGDATAHLRLVRSGVQGWHVYQASTGLEFQEDGASAAGLALISGGGFTTNGKAKLGDFTVATLPSASANAGYECNVTDSSVTTFGSTVAGGGSSRVKLYSNGTNWTVQAA